MSNSRQLAAIMFTDIVGYTSMMGKDESKAIEILRKNRELQKPIVEEFEGRWIKELGDGVMTSFNTVSDAVNAAIKIQKTCSASHDFLLRIGIHLGEVVFENGDVFGDGVNVASRIVSLAEPGGIFVSGKIYAEIKNQKSIESVFLGMYDLKNVASSVEIFAISNAGINIPKRDNLRTKGNETFSKRKSSKNLLLKIGVGVLLLLLIGFFYIKFYSVRNNTVEDKSIAVLPFVNLSSEKNDEYFTDGMCDEILTNLSKIGDLKVISRTSVLQYKDTKKNLREIAEELGVNNILEGSVQKSNDRIRINVQLINAKTDEHLWAESYDRENKDVFLIQSEIAKKIAIELNASLSEKERSSIDQKPTDNLQAYDFYMRGKNYSDSYYGINENEMLGNVERMFRAAIRLDPEFVEAYFGLITTYLDIYWNGQQTNNNEYKLKAKSLLDSLLSLNIDKPVVHLANGYYKYHGERNYNGALAEFDIVEKSNFNNSEVVTAKGFVFRRIGKLNDAIKNFQRAIELNPNFLEGYVSLYETYIFDRKPDEAINVMNKALTLAPDQSSIYVAKADAYIDYKNDLGTARKILDGAKNFVAASELNNTYEFIDLIEGNSKRFINTTSMFTDSLYAHQSVITSYALELAQVFKAEGNLDSSKKYFNRNRQLMEILLEKSPDDFRVHCNLGIDFAGLGEKEKALKHARLACQLMPLSKDGLIGIVPLEGLALVYTYLGQQDEAIEILEKILKEPRGFARTATIPLYKSHYFWKPLRNNPKFKKMIQ